MPSGLFIEQPWRYAVTAEPRAARLKFHDPLPVAMSGGPTPDHVQ